MTYDLGAVLREGDVVDRVATDVYPLLPYSWSHRCNLVLNKYRLVWRGESASNDSNAVIVCFSPYYNIVVVVIHCVCTCICVTSPDDLRESSSLARSLRVDSCYKGHTDRE